MVGQYLRNFKKSQILILNDLGLSRMRAIKWGLRLEDSENETESHRFSEQMGCYGRCIPAWQGLLVLSFLITGIVILSVGANVGVTPNARGYIVPGGSCKVMCGGITAYECSSYGLINVTFYFEKDSTVWYWTLTEAPYICDSEAFEDIICCQQYVEKSTLLWIAAEDYDENIVVTHISRVSNEKSYEYMMAGSLLMILTVIIGLLVLWCNRGWLFNCSHSYSAV